MDCFQLQQQNTHLSSTRLLKLFESQAFKLYSGSILLKIREEYQKALRTDEETCHIQLKNNDTIGVYDDYKYLDVIENTGTDGKGIKQRMRKDQR